MSREELVKELKAKMDNDEPIMLAGQIDSIIEYECNWNFGYSEHIFKFSSGSLINIKLSDNKFQSKSLKLNHLGRNNYGK